MPTREAHIRRWQIAASFVVMAAVFVVLLAWIDSTSKEAHKVSTEAHRLSIENRNRITEISRLRSERVRELHDQDLRFCRRIHKLVAVQRAGLLRARHATTNLSPGAIAPEVRAKSLAIIAQQIRDLRHADCHTIPPVPPPGQKP